jgi:hypothetical protein
VAKVSEKAKIKYQEKIKEYKAITNEIIQNEREIASQFRKGEVIYNAQRLELADRNLVLVSYYTLINSLSLALLGIKNESYLNEARKCLYKAIIYLEEIVSAYIDVPFSDYEEGLMSIEDLDDISRYKLVNRIGFSIKAVEDGFGENSKWKWSFVELEGRFATVTKNLINFKTFIAKLDPRIEGYPERIAHADLAKNLLQNAADGYRQKYELSTRRIDDIQLAINYLSALKRIHVLLGETEQAEVTKRKIDIWKTKMESDLKQLKERDRKARLSQQNVRRGG